MTSKKFDRSRLSMFENMNKSNSTVKKEPPPPRKGFNSNRLAFLSTLNSKNNSSKIRSKTPDPKPSKYKTTQLQNKNSNKSQSPKQPPKPPPPSKNTSKTDNNNDSGIVVPKKISVSDNPWKNNRFKQNNNSTTDNKPIKPKPLKKRPKKINPKFANMAGMINLNAFKGVKPKKLQKKHDPNGPDITSVELNKPVMKKKSRKRRSRNINKNLLDKTVNDTNTSFTIDKRHSTLGIPNVNKLFNNELDELKEETKDNNDSKEDENNDNENEGRHRRSSSAPAPEVLNNMKNIVPFQSIKIMSNNPNKEVINNGKYDYYYEEDSPSPPPVPPVPKPNPPVPPPVPKHVSQQLSYSNEIVSMDGDDDKPPPVPPVPKDDEDEQLEDNTITSEALAFEKLVKKAEESNTTVTRQRSTPVIKANPSPSTSKKPPPKRNSLRSPRNKPDKPSKKKFEKSPKYTLYGSGNVMPEFKLNSTKKSNKNKNTNNDIDSPILTTSNNKDIKKAFKLNTDETKEDSIDNTIQSLESEIKDLENLIEIKKNQIIELKIKKMKSKLNNMTPIELLKRLTLFCQDANKEQLAIVRNILQTNSNT